MSGPPPIAVGLGRCDEMRAEVLLSLAADAGVRLTGTLTGPRRGRDTTLPTTTTLVPLAGPETGPQAVSRAILTEPAYWTPELPNLYRLQAAIGIAGAPAAGRIDTLVGLRRLGLRGRSFWLDGRRWVPRAVARAGAADLAASKAAMLGVVADDAAVDMARSDEAGVAVLALVDATGLSPERIAAIARHPSAMLVIVHGDAAPRRLAEVRRAAGTMLIGRLADGHDPPPDSADVDFIAVAIAAGGVPHDGWRSAPGVPLVAWRHDAAAETAGRAACDRLQRDLAAWGMAGGGRTSAWDWAGYVVGRGPDAAG